ncbi:hypothetical protein HZB03_05445 [Candidatus Woesearchaeota archaeon]|nr:hypothetical protein [Candidatus Woesearchaeota archaeon]
MLTTPTIPKGVLLLFVLSICAVSVLGTIDITPEQLNFDAVLWGSDAQKTMTITSDSSTTLFVEPVVSKDFSSNIQVSANGPLAVKKDVPLQLKITAQGNALGLSEGTIDLYFSTAGTNLGSASDTFVQIPVTLSVVSQGRRQILIKDSSISNTEVGGIANLEISFENAGSVDIAPSIIATIDDRSTQRFIAKIRALDAQAMNFPLLASNLAAGTHEANIIVKDNDITLLDRTVSFNVLPAANHAKEGDIVDVILPQQNTIGNEITGGAVFRNSGKEPLIITVKTDVSKDNRIIKHSEETFFVPANQTRIAHVGFTPNTSGSYLVTSYADFAGTATAVTQRTIELTTPNESLERILPVFVVLFVGIIFIASYKKRFHHSKKGGQILNKELEQHERSTLR